MAGAGLTHPKTPVSPNLHICLNLPIPPSVNRIRRVDWANNRKRKEYYLRSDLFLTAYGPRPAPVRMITGPYELTIQIPEKSRLDLDNHHKALIDYLVSREFVPSDNPRYLRRFIVEWALIEHCRVTIHSLSPDWNRENRENREPQCNRGGPRNVSPSSKPAGTMERPQERSGSQ
jgi:hypothetical protein